jgi:hypothetical protein
MGLYLINLKKDFNEKTKIKKILKLNIFFINERIFDVL